MTEAGDRIMNRRTIVRHKETGLEITVDNSDIPVHLEPRSHIQQRELALQLMARNLGTAVDIGDCTFEFIVDDES